MPIKPLKPNEVTPEHRKYCDFSRQQLRKGLLHISVQCPGCNHPRWVQVCEVRRRHALPRCYSCGQVASPLESHELPAQEAQHCDFSQQELRLRKSGLGRALCIQTQCPDCGRWRWSNVSLIRRSGHVYRCRSCAAHLRSPTGKFTKDGYIMLNIMALSKPDQALALGMTSGTAIAEHRLVMARDVGRALGPCEHVHHRNGHKCDNRLANLRLVSRNMHCQAPADDIAKLSVEIEHLARAAALNNIDPQPALRHFIKELRTVAGRG